MLEDRLESVERQLIRLTKTLQDLITMYVESNTDSILSGLPKHSGYIPQFIKERDNNLPVTLQDVQLLVEPAITVFGADSVREMLTQFSTKNGEAVTALSQLKKSDYPECYEYFRVGLGLRMDDLRK